MGLKDAITKDTPRSAFAVLDPNAMRSQVDVIGDMGVCGNAIPCCMVVCGTCQVKTKVVFLDGQFLRGPRFIVLLAVS